MKFIDLFAGLGGFHLGLSRLGHKCVYACEINPVLNELYKKNFPKTPIDLDIKNVDLKKVPKYDILCAGFPCQPFSKAGAQTGFDHKIAGEMFEEIIKFLEFHMPKYVILENVPNLIKHNKGLTWDYMSSRLEATGYNLEYDIISPIDFNIPQTRERAYILCTRGQEKIKWPMKPITKKISLNDIFIKKPQIVKTISKDKKDIILMWDDFLKRIPKDVELISPLWTLEFGANYPFEDTTPFALGGKGLKPFKGSRGKKLSEIEASERINFIPPYAQYSSTKTEKISAKNEFPDWKKKFIRKSRKFYQENKHWIDPWIKKFENHPNPTLKQPTHAKLEWNCLGDSYTMDDKVISFRASGMRVKRMDAAPTLVNLSSSAVPYIPSLNRYMSHEECLKIQGLHELINDNLPKEFEFYRAVGNAVNADVVEKIAEAFLDKCETKKYRSKLNQLNLQLKQLN